MIGIYGGSFDPPHKGHLNLINGFWENFPNADQLIIVPNKLSPFKNQKSVHSENIFEMINLLIKENNIQNTSVSRFELDSDSVSYTILTVKEIKEKYNDNKLYLIIGADNITKFHKWKDYKSILDNTNLLIFKRPNFNLEIPTELKIFHEKIKIIDHKEIEASSSEFRKLKKEEILTPQILNYIKKNSLYGY